MRAPARSQPTASARRLFACCIRMSATPLRRNAALRRATAAARTASAAAHSAFDRSRPVPLSTVAASPACASARCGGTSTGPGSSPVLSASSARATGKSACGGSAGGCGCMPSGGGVDDGDGGGGGRNPKYAPGGKPRRGYSGIGSHPARAPVDVPLASTPRAPAASSGPPASSASPLPIQPACTGMTRPARRWYRPRRSERIISFSLGALTSTARQVSAASAAAALPGSCGVRSGRGGGRNPKCAPGGKPRRG